jgi:hypothetical protein
MSPSTGTTKEPSSDSAADCWVGDLSIGNSLKTEKSVAFDRILAKLRKLWLTITKFKYLENEGKTVGLKNKLAEKQCH